MKLSQYAILILTFAPMAAPASSATRLTVCLEESVVVPTPVLMRSRGLASKMLADVDVQVDWRARRPDESAPRENGCIVVHFLEHASADTFPGALAFARPLEGVHVNVFYDRIQKLREGLTPIGLEQVLAHVLVHEITHILQGIPRHSESGIMKAHWSERDYMEMLWKPLSFTPEDVALIRDGLVARSRRTSSNRESNLENPGVK